MSSYRWLRVICEDDEQANSPLVIDLLVDENWSVKFGPPYCGWWGNLKSTDVLPFVAKVLSDDVYVLDAGSDDETNQDNRYDLFNLIHGTVNVGRKFKLKYGSDWYSFTVKSLSDMVENKVY